MLVIQSATEYRYSCFSPRVWFDCSVLTPWLKVFNADYSHRADIGKRGGKEGKSNGEFSYPVASTVCFDGNLAVVDRKNHRVQIFEKTGKGDSWELRFKAKFGGQGTPSFPSSYLFW